MLLQSKSENHRHCLKNFILCSHHIVVNPPMEVPPPPDGDPTADIKSTADRKPLEIVLSYPGRIWRAVAGAIPSPDPNLLSKIRIPNVSSLSGLSILLRSQRRRHGLPLPLHSTSVHSIRCVLPLRKSAPVFKF